MSLNVQARFERLDALLAANRVCRNKWYDGPPTDDGYERRRRRGRRALTVLSSPSSTPSRRGRRGAR